MARPLLVSLQASGDGLLPALSLVQVLVLFNGIAAAGYLSPFQLRLGQWNRDEGYSVGSHQRRYKRSYQTD